MSTTTRLSEAQSKGFVVAAEADPARKRLEIDELLDDNDKTNLFLLALAELQQEVRDKKGDWFSYYSLSSIHGFPRELWNNVENLNPLDPGESPLDGYCAHGSIVFPTWHRVYLLMFEQSLINKMQEIAQRFTQTADKQKYQSAADRFRLPFWDPFMPRNKTENAPNGGFSLANNTLSEKVFGIPKILSQPKVFVKRWDGPKQIDNPLYSFRFPDSDILKSKERYVWKDEDWWTDNWKRDRNGNWFKDGKIERVPKPGRLETLRCPNHQAKSNYFDERDDGGKDTAEGGRGGLNLKIQRQAQNMSASLWRLLTPYVKDGQKGAPTNATRTWASFANHSLGRGPSISIESFHDSLHGLVGSGTTSGHMGDPAIAAFDPIFWLHHNNIDRIFAIYQALYPDVSDNLDEAPDDPSKWVPAKDKVKKGETNAETLLYPFRKDDTNYWNSNDVKDWTQLGFAVPGAERLNKKGRIGLTKYLRENYYWASEFDNPPDSVKKYWPRKLQYSYALNGPNAVARPEDDDQATSVEYFEALTKDGLVTRTVKVAAQAKALVFDEIRPVEFVEATKVEAIYPAGSTELVDDKSQMQTWSAQIKVKKFAFNGTFNVHIFLGEPKLDQPVRYFTKKNEVGFSTIFASSFDAPCDNCVKQRDSGLIYEDAVPLTMSLTKYLETYDINNNPGPREDDLKQSLKDLKPENVVPWLQKNLYWVITNTASEVIDDVSAIQASELEVSVWDRYFEFPNAENRLGLYRAATVHPEATSGRPGGLGYTYPA